MKFLLVCLLFFTGCASGPNPYSVVDPSDPWHTRNFPIQGQPLMNQRQSVNVTVNNFIGGGSEPSRKVLKKEVYREGKKVKEEKYD